MEKNFYRCNTSPSEGGSRGIKDSGLASQKESVDLFSQLLINPATTCFLLVNSEAMTGMGIHKGDVIIVDRAMEASNGKIVIADLDGEKLIRRYEIADGRKCLAPATPRLAPIDTTGNPAFSIWGVVIFVIHGV